MPRRRDPDVEDLPGDGEARRCGPRRDATDAAKALDEAVAAGFPILKRISRNAAAKAIEHRVVFGFSCQTAPILVEFLQAHEAHLRHVTGLRYSGEIDFHPAIAT